MAAGIIALRSIPVSGHETEPHGAGLAKAVYNKFQQQMKFH